MGQVKNDQISHGFLIAILIKELIEMRILPHYTNTVTL